MINSATIAHLTGIKLKKLYIPVPDVKLQLDFKLKLSNIYTQKTLMQASLTQLENNYHSLMQRAFKGQLFQ